MIIFESDKEGGMSTSTSVIRRRFAFLDTSSEGISSVSLQGMNLIVDGAVDVAIVVTGVGSINRISGIGGVCRPSASRFKSEGEGG
jgi:hypothetical protein